MGTRKEAIIVTADTSDAVRGFAAVGAAASALTTRLEQADGRMANIVQTGLALGPALVPLGAVAVPAVAGLANQLGIAALAAGAAVLAFQGVGTATKALQDYKVAPTAANFAKLKQAFEGLGPAGQEFALYVDKLRPRLVDLRKVAEQGLLPGVEDSIKTLLPLLPQVQNVIFSLTSTMGNLIEKGATNLRSSEWGQFFGFLEADAATTLEAMGKTVGSLAQAFAILWMDFAPLSDGFSSGMVKMAASFERWAANLSQTQGFQSFLNYLRETGPQVLRTLGALANGLLQVVEAAAPVGNISLHAITGIATAIGALADSSVGPLILGAAAAIGVLGRSLSLLEVIGVRGNRNLGAGGSYINSNYVKPFQKALPAVRALSVATKEQADADHAARIAHAQYIGTLRASSTMLELQGKPNTKAGKAAANELNKANERSAAAAKKVAEAERSRSAALRETAASAGKASIATAGLLVATTGVADGMGLAHTAEFAMMGALAGPWGAAVGGAIGLAKDFASANNEVENAVSNAGSALAANNGSFTTQAQALDTATSAFDRYNATVEKGKSASFWLNPKNMLDFGTAITTVADGYTHTSKELSKQQRAQNADFMTMNQNVAEVYADLDHGSTKLLHSTTAVRDAFVSHITPALAQAGIEVKDFKHSLNGSPLRIEGEKAIRSYFGALSSATGQSANVGKALAQLGHDATSAVDPVERLKAALDNLFGNRLSLSQSMDDATRALGDMKKALKDTNGQLEGNGAKALDARDKVRAYAAQQIQVAEAQAKAHHSGTEVGNSLLAIRRNFIDSARAAHINEGAIQSMIRQMGLTPKNLVTIIKQDGALNATEKVKALAAIYNRTPHAIKTLISEAGAHPTAAKIDALAKKYHLTPRQVRTILSAVDNASRKALKAKQMAEQFKKKYQAYLEAKDNGSKKAKDAKKVAEKYAKDYLAYLKANNLAGPGKAAAQAIVDSFHGKSVDLTVNVHRNVFSAARTALNPSLNKPAIDQAEGGYIRGPGTSTSDSIPANLSDGEYVVRAAAVDKYGVGLMHRINSLALASGGYVRRGFARGGSVTGLVDNSTELTRVASELRELRKELKTQRNSKNTRKLRNEYAGTTAANFLADPFSGTLGGFNNQIATETKKLAGTQTDLRSLRKAGLSGGLLKDLAASGNSALIHQFAGLSSAQIASEEQAYRHRNNLSLAVGHQAANMAFPSIHELKHEIHVLAHELHQLRHGKHLGNHVTNFNGKVSAKDTEALAKKIHEKQRQAARLARNS